MEETSGKLRVIGMKEKVQLEQLEIFIDADILVGKVKFK